MPRFQKPQEEPANNRQEDKKLTAAARKKIKTKNFALPGKAKTAKAKAKSGNYPIPDPVRARAALSLVAKYGTPSEKARVRAAVRKKFPNIGKGGKKKK